MDSTAPDTLYTLTALPPNNSELFRYGLHAFSPHFFHRRRRYFKDTLSSPWPPVPPRPLAPPEPARLVPNPPMRLPSSFDVTETIYQQYQQSRQRTWDSNEHVTPDRRQNGVTRPVVTNPMDCHHEISRLHSSHLSTPLQVTSTRIMSSLNSEALPFTPSPIRPLHHRVPSLRSLSGNARVFSPSSPLVAPLASQSSPLSVRTARSQQLLRTQMRLPEISPLSSPSTMYPRDQSFAGSSRTKTRSRSDSPLTSSGTPIAPNYDSGIQAEKELAPKIAQRDGNEPENVQPTSRAIMWSDIVRK